MPNRQPGLFLLLRFVGQAREMRSSEISSSDCQLGSVLLEHQRMRHVVIALLLLSACSTPSGRYPSLQPRAAEKIDPRLPVVRAMNNRPTSEALAGRLAYLVDEARSAEPAFDAAAVNAERVAAGAGARQSEGWIVAQEALTAAIAARKPIVSALSDIDEIGANSLQKQGGIAPNDLAAIDRAAAEVAEIDKRQAERIKSIQKRLGV